MIKIPKFFHELLGEEQSVSSLIVIIVFVLGLGLLLGTLAYDEWQRLSLSKQIIAWLLYLDISGGVIANLTKGTDEYYKQRPKARWVFIAIHIQPILLAWAMDMPMVIGIIIYTFTLLLASLLNILREYPIQKPLAGCAVAIGWLIIAFFAKDMSFFAITINGLYTFKVLFSFSVSHY